jgi:uncharacterized protein (UPF0305 family)
MWHRKRKKKQRDREKRVESLRGEREKKKRRGRKETKNIIQIIFITCFFLFFFKKERARLKSFFGLKRKKRTAFFCVCQEKEKERSVEIVRFLQTFCVCAEYIEEMRTLPTSN